MSQTRTKRAPPLVQVDPPTELLLQVSDLVLFQEFEKLFGPSRRPFHSHTQINFRGFDVADWDDSEGGKPSALGKNPGEMHRFRIDEFDDSKWDDKGYSGGVILRKGVFYPTQKLCRAYAFCMCLNATDEMLEAIGWTWDKYEEMQDYGGLGRTT